MKRVLLFLLAAGLISAGCAKDTKQSAEQSTPASTEEATQSGSAQTEQPAAQPQEQAPPSTPPAAQEQAPPAKPAADFKPAPQETPKKSPEFKPPRKPEEQAAPQMVTRLVPVPSGAELTANLDGEVSTKEDKAGSEFTATLPEPYQRGGIDLLPAGTKIQGKVVAAKRAGSVGGKAEMTLEFSQITTPDGKTYTLFAQPLALEGKSTVEGDVGKVVGGAIGGAIVGGILGGKKGAGKGAAAGGAAGAAWAVATKGNDIVLDPGTPVKVTVNREFEVPVQMRSDQQVP